MSKYSKRMSLDCSIISPGPDNIHEKVWDPANIQWVTELEGPNSFPRKYHSMVFFQNQLLVYGGMNSEGVILDDLVSFRLSHLRWLPAAQNLGSPPHPLYSHTSLVQPSRSILYILGGYKEDGKPNTNVYTQDLKSFVWTKYPFSSKTIREGSAFVNHGSTIVQVGGKDRNGKLSNIVSVFSDKKGWNIMSTKGDVPSGRWKHSCCVCDIYLYMFGGITSKGTTNNLYMLNLLSYTWSRLSLPNGPSARYGASFICALDVIFLIGGRVSDKEEVPAEDRIYVLVNDGSNQNWKHIQVPLVDAPASYEGAAVAAISHTQKNLIVISNENKNIFYLSTGHEFGQPSCGSGIMERRNRSKQETGISNIWKQIRGKNAKSIPEVFPTEEQSGTPVREKQKFSPDSEISYMSIAKVRERVEEIFDRYIIESNADKRTIKVRFEDIVALQKAMEIERDRAAKAKLQKDSQQAKYEQQVEANMKKETQCKKLQEKVKAHNKLFETIQQEMTVMKDIMEEHLPAEQLSLMNEAMASVEKNMKRAQIRDDYVSRTKRQQQTVRVSVPLPQVPQFAQELKSDHFVAHLASTDLTITTDVRKKTENLAKQNGVNESYMLEHFMLASNLSTYNDTLTSIYSKQHKADEQDAIFTPRTVEHLKNASPRHAMIRKLSSASLQAQAKPSDSSIKAYNNVLNELINTEQKYVCDLVSTITIYVVPLRDTGRILTKEEANTLFFNIEEIASNQRELLASLTAQRNLEVEKQTIGEEILRFIPLVNKLYAPYCANLVYSRHLRKRLIESNPAFGAFLTKALNDPRTEKQDIKSFLIKPLQRLCKYPLLLRELRKYSPVKQDILDQAAEKMNGVLNRVNESMHESDQQEILLELQDMFDDVKTLLPVQLSHPNRKLIEKGTVIQYSDKAKRYRSLICTILLFSDMLILVCDVSDKSHKKSISVLSAVIPLDECIVEEITPTTKDIPFPRGEDPDNIFLIKQKTQSNFSIIICESQREKVKWMADILVQVDKFKSNKISTP